MAARGAVMAQVTATADTASPGAALLRRTARGGALNLLGAAVAGAGGIATSWLVADGLGPQVAGQFFAATSAFLLAVSIARLGTPTGLVYWVARSRQRKHTAALRAILTGALIPVGVVSVVVAIAGIAGARLLAVGRSGDIRTYVEMLRVLAVFLPFAVALDALLAATRGFGRMRDTVVIDKMGRTGAQLVLLAAVVWWQAGPVAVTLAWTLPYLPAALAAAWGLHHRVTHRLTADEAAPPPWPQTVRRFWRYTAPRALAGVAQLALQRLDILLVAALLGFTQAAIYTVATRFISVGQLIAGAIGSAVQPRLATSMSKPDYPTAQTLYQATTGWIVAATWPMYLIVAMAAPWYLRLFGAEYATSQAVTVVWILAAGMLLATACGVVDNVLVMAGRTGWQLYSVLAAVAVNLILDVWLIPRLGIVGAAIGWAAAIAVNNVVPLLQLTIGFGLHPLGRGTMTAMATSAVCCGLVPLCGRFGGEFGQVVAIPAAMAAYVGISWRARKTLILSGRE